MGFGLPPSVFLEGDGHRPAIHRLLRRPHRRTRYGTSGTSRAGLPAGVQLRNGWYADAAGDRPPPALRSFRVKAHLTRCKVGWSSGHGKGGINGYAAPVWRGRLPGRRASTHARGVVRGGSTAGSGRGKCLGSPDCFSSSPFVPSHIVPGHTKCVYMRVQDLPYYFIFREVRFCMVISRNRACVGKRSLGLCFARTTSPASHRPAADRDAPPGPAASPRGRRGPAQGGGAPARRRGTCCGRGGGERPLEVSPRRPRSGGGTGEVRFWGQRQGKSRSEDIFHR